MREAAGAAATFCCSGVGGAPPALGCEVALDAEESAGGVTEEPSSRTTNPSA